jgi:hypothetical protein
MWVRINYKFYAGNLGGTTEGLTCHKIADQIEQYTEVENTNPSLIFPNLGRVTSLSKMVPR